MYQPWSRLWNWDADIITPLFSVPTVNIRFLLSDLWLLQSLSYARALDFLLLGTLSSILLMKDFLDFLGFAFGFVFCFQMLFITFKHHSYLQFLICLALALSIMYHAFWMSFSHLYCFIDIFIYFFVYCLCFLFVYYGFLSAYRINIQYLLTYRITFHKLGKYM